MDLFKAFRHHLLISMKGIVMIVKSIIIEGCNGCMFTTAASNVFRSFKLIDRLSKSKGIKPIYSWQKCPVRYINTRDILYVFDPINLNTI